MALTAGTRLGVYEVTTQIGEGGMGQVWRAHDTKLNRDVALKVLPDSFANDPDRLARFTREAQTLAALNHPNIAHIHGLEESDGVRALVMELVEGEDLSKPIARGAILIDEALPIAKQIADALEAAHEQGIIHRDLKPANIKVRDDGTVKVLDFGLSKALDPTGASSADVMNSPTLTARATQMGVILGTAAYMSPEQARGKPVDKRTDIWAFGCVLYEMLTATRAFVGDDVTDTVAAVLRAEPDWRAVPENVPTGVVNVLRRCLEKDRKARIPEIAAVRYLLEDALTAKPATVSATVVAPAIPPRQPWMLIVATALVVGVLAAAAGWRLKRIPPVSLQVVTRFTYSLPEGQAFTRTGRHVLAISPDGTKVVYVANNQLYLRAMDQLDAQPIRGTKEDPMEPVFSPDGQWIAFFVPTTSTGEGTGGWALKKIAASGGASVTLGQLPGAPHGAAWRHGMIAFGMNAKDVYGIQAVPEGGGSPRTLVAVDPKTERAAQPQLLDDGAHMLFVVTSVDSGELQIVVQGLNGDARKVLVRGGTNPHLLPTGQLVYIHDGTLLAVAFDARQFAVLGGPVPLVDGVSEANPTGAGQFAVSSDGTLAFVPGSTNRRALVWVDRHGNEEAIPAPARAYGMPRLSPDGTKIAVDSDDEGHDIWVFDLAKKTLTPITFGPALEQRPLWTLDGKSVVFGRRSGELDIFRQAADGTGAPEALTQHGGGGWPWSVSPDRTLLYEKLPNPSDVRVLSLDRPAESRPLLADPKFDEWGAALSPDGRWLAYSSNLSGRHEVYVRPFPNVDSERRQISSEGGAWPRWARSGRELFFVKMEFAATITPDADLMAVPIQPGAAFTSGTPQVLFKVSAYSYFFDVDLDAKRFLMIKSVGAATSARPFIVVVSHWFDEVRARVGR